MLRVCTLIFCLGIFFISSAQEKPLPEELKPFVLPGHEVLDFVTGDLTGDKKPDAILIQHIMGEDTLLDQDYPRPMMILVRQLNGKLKQVIRNDSAILCRHCGGLFGDPYAATSIGKNGFSFSFYGGSAWRWAYEYRFTWNAIQKTWLLTLENRNTFNSNDPEMKMTEANIRQAELGDITISRFNPLRPVYDDTRWKVTAAKTFFYDSPELGSKPRKGYLLKGDTVIAIRQLKNFIEVSFENKNGEFTEGFILRRDLLQIK